MILVYSASYVVEEVLLHTMSRGVQFRVIVADAGPKFEGRELMQRLMGAGLRCTYVNLHALSYMMPEVSKLLLGASSMLLNGTLLARAGTALVSMLAHEHGVPVLVCCETYKFAERVLLDSICFNEVRAAHALPTRLPHACLAPASRPPRARLAPPTPLGSPALACRQLGDPDELIPPNERADTAAGAASASGAATATGGAGAAESGSAGPARVADWRDIPRLKLLNLMYDATPMKYLTSARSPQAAVAVAAAAARSRSAPAPPTTPPTCTAHLHHPPALRTYTAHLHHPLARAPGGRLLQLHSRVALRVPAAQWWSRRSV